MIIYIRDPGVFGVVLKYWPDGCDAKWYLDGIQFKGFLLEEEYLEYREGQLGGTDID